MIRARSSGPGMLLGWAVVALGLLSSGCGGAAKEDPILRLSAEEAITKGKELMERKKYTQAEPYLAHAFEVAPNSAIGREALLLAADALYLAGGTANFIKAEAKYRDFKNRFPTSARGDYVQLQIAKCLAEQMLRPDRDQTATRQALEAFEEMMQLYPTSEYSEEATSRIIDIRQDLADHEFIVGKYNFRRRLYTAAAARLEGLLEAYPDYREMDKVLFFLGRTYHRLKREEDAAATFERLRTEHPESPFLRKLPLQKKAQP